MSRFFRVPLNRPEYRNITRAERALVIRGVQEAYAAPSGSVSALELARCPAEAARRNTGKAGDGARKTGDSPEPQ